jgi:hypothetical protein
MTTYPVLRILYILDGSRQIIGRIGIHPMVAEVFKHRRVVMIKLLAQVDSVTGIGLRQFPLQEVRLLIYTVEIEKCYKRNKDWVSVQLSVIDLKIQYF